MSLSREAFDLAEQRAAGKSYPVYVNNLREIGVESYWVSVASGDRRIFSAANEPVLEIPGIGKQLSCAEGFDEAALKTALHRTQTGQSDYPTFMAEIAAAGVHNYTADLLQHTVTYIGKNPSDKYAETVPHADSK